MIAQTPSLIKPGRATSRILLRKLLLFACVLPLIRPDGLATILAALDKGLYVYWKYCAIIIIMFRFYLYILKGGRLKSGSIVLLVFVGLTFLLTLLKGIEVTNWYHSFASCIAIICLTEVEHNRLDQLLRTSLLCLKVLIYLNFICMLLYPNGMYFSISNGYQLNWLLGYKSSFQYYLLPAVCFEWLTKCYHRNKVSSYLFLAICFAEVLLSQNAMLLAGLVILYVILIFRMYRFVKIFNFWIYCALALVFNVLFVSLTELVLNNGFINYVIVTLLHKTLTLSTRASIIWPTTIQYIAKSPLFGYGVWSSDERISMYQNVAGAIHAHNQLLEVLFIGGIVLMSIYVTFHIIVGRKLSKFKHTFPVQVISAVLFILYIMTTFEIFLRQSGSFIWILYLFGLRCDEVDQQFKTHYQIQTKKMIA